METQHKQLVTMVTNDGSVIPYTTSLSNGNLATKERSDPLTAGSPTVKSRSFESQEKQGLCYSDVEGQTPNGQTTCSRGRPDFEQRSWCRLRSHLELYLLILCMILFLACIGFVVIAFTREYMFRKDNVCTTNVCVQTAAALMDGMDTSVDPCEDFYQYACGTWLKKHVIPEDKAGYNTFEKIHEELRVVLKALLEEPKNEKDSSATMKAKILYKSCMNTDQIEKMKDFPLREVLNFLGGWPILSKNEWSGENWTLEDVMARSVRHYGAPFLIYSYVEADDKNSSAYILQLNQADLGMYSNTYYQEPGVQMDAYLKYMVSVATLMGAEETKAWKELKEILDFETELANITLSREQRQDASRMYEKMTVRQLGEKVPEINWLRYFRGFMLEELIGEPGITENEMVVAHALPYFRRLGQLVAKTPKKIVANYISWRITMAYASDLTEAFQQHQNQYNRVIQGTSRNTIRWHKCVEHVNERMGMAMGALYVQDNFKEKNRDTAREMIESIRAAFVEILMESDWMDDETKAVARDKAHAMVERIGYADAILNRTELDLRFSKLDFKEDEYFKNVLKQERFSAEVTFRRLRKPVVRDRWDKSPAVVNAFYSPNGNDMVIPAGILRPHFYNQHYPKSLNYGGIGVVIGHEITHGFDDKGRKFDKDGNLRLWWNNETIEAFNTRAQCIIDQYSNYTLEPWGLKIDGISTQGENIADNGGLTESFRAYRTWVRENGEEAPLPGLELTHNQLFFLNYAQIWCGNMRKEDAIFKVRTGSHPPGSIRVLGPLSNSYDFARAYKCSVGSRMNPIKKCSVW